MYYYVEYLRATRALRIAGIILGLLLVAGIVFRLAFIHGASPEAYARALQTSPTAHVTKTQLPDGSTRTVVDDPDKRIHATIVQNGRDLRMDVTEPTRTLHDQYNDNVSMGSINVNEDTHGGLSHVTMTYKGGMNMSWSALFAGSAVVGLILATMLGGPLAKENDGHLELAWTKPVSREAYAIAALAIDIAAIVLSQLATIAVVLIVALMWVPPMLTLGAGGVALIALSLLTPIAWFACLTAFSASLKRGLGMVIGLGWFASLMIPALMHATEGMRAPLGVFFHAIFTGLAYIDPIVYFPSFSSGHMRGNLINTLEQAAAGAAALALGYMILAVLQWRRVEA